MLPETATRKAYRRWPWYVLAVMALAALFFAGVALLRGGGFSPGEEMYAPAFEDIAVSTEDTSYPASDVLRFNSRPEALYVYLVVEDLPGGSPYWRGCAPVMPAGTWRRGSSVPGRNRL